MSPVIPFLHSLLHFPKPCVHFTITRTGFQQFLRKNTGTTKKTPGNTGGTGTFSLRPIMSYTIFHSRHLWLKYKRGLLQTAIKNPDEPLVIHCLFHALKQQMPKPDERHRRSCLGPLRT